MVPKKIENFYRYTDVVEEIGQTYDLNDQVKTALNLAMAASILSGELKTRDTNTGLKINLSQTGQNLSPSVYITEQDAKTWLRDQGLPYQWQPNQASRHMSVLVQRQELIIQKIKELGYNPQRLPKAPSGKPGVKNQVKMALGSTGLWSGKSVFEKAWEALRESEEIASK